MFQSLQDQIKNSKRESKRKQIEKIEQEQKARKDALSSASGARSGVNPKPAYHSGNFGNSPVSFLKKLAIFPFQILGYALLSVIIIGSLSFFFNRFIDLKLTGLFITFIIFFIFGIIGLGLYFMWLLGFLRDLKSGRARFSVSGSFLFVFVTFIVLILGFFALVSPFGVYYLGKDFFAPTQKICGLYLGPTGNRVNVGSREVVYYKTEYKFLIDNAEKNIAELKLDYKQVPINSNICFDYKPNSQIINNDRIE